MSEPELIQKQRELLRTFRRATTERAEVEADAEARRKTQLDSAGVALSQVRLDLAKKIAQVHQSLATAEIALGWAGLQLDVFNNVKPVQHADVTVDASRKLALGISEAVQAGQSIERSVQAWWERQILGMEELGRLHHRHGFLNQASAAVEFVIFSPDKQCVASVSDDDAVRIWDLSTQRESRVFREASNRCVFSPDSRKLAINKFQSISIFDISSGRLLQMLNPDDWDDFRIQGLAFLRDGNALIWGGYNIRYIGGQERYRLDLAVFVSDVSSGAKQGGFDRKIFDVPTYLTFSPDGAVIATTTNSTDWVTLLDAYSGRDLHVLKGHDRPVGAVSFSPDGRLLASSGGERTVRIWEVESGREIYTLRGHTDWVKTLAFSPDGKTLVSGSDDQTVRIWDITTGQEKRLLSHSAGVNSVAFSPDGKILGSGSSDGTLRLWAAPNALPEMEGLLALVQSNISVLMQSPRVAQLLHNQSLEQAEQEHQRRVSEIETKYQQTIADAASVYNATVTKTGDDITKNNQSAGLLAASWNDTLWESSRPAEDSSIPTVPRVGQLVEVGKWHRLTLPALIPLIGSRPLLLKASGSTKITAANVIQSLLLRLLASVPPAKLHFTFFDPVGLGQNVASFMHLADYDEALIAGKAWTELQHIEQRLADLTEHMENVIQKYLRNQFAAIEDYNAQAGEIAEPYRVLVVFDFPANFSEAAARRLVSIAQNGPRCGVYAVILADTTLKMPYSFDLSELERACTVINWDGKRFVWQDEDFKDCLLELDSPPDNQLVDRIISQVGEAAKESSKVEVPFERIAPPLEEWWKGDSRTGLRVPLGPSGARKIQYLDLAKGTAQHALVVGKTGSGKSTLLHTLITDLTLAYSPTEVELYLVDFKKGVEFKTYATHQLPHARVIAIESEREFGLSVLQGLDAELKRRGDLFRATGVDHIADYRQKSKGAGEQRSGGELASALPRILLIVDEFQEFFTEDDAIASQASQVLDRLVRQGRAFGIHVLLGSQTLAGAYTLARSTIDQMAVRIALQCSEADSRLILADDNPAARLLSRPGEAIYNAANGLVEGNNRFQVAWLPDDKRDQYLERVQELAQKQQYRPPRPQIVFEGNASAEVEKNRTLSDLIASPTFPAPSRVTRAWIGEPIAIRDSVAANFRRQSGSNLIIVGQNDEAAMGMMAVALTSFAAQLQSYSAEGAEANFYILDFGTADASYADYFTRFVEYLPRPPKIGRRRELPEFISELEAQVQRRMDASEANAPIYLFLYGLQRARDLRQDEGMGFSLGSEEPAAPNLSQQFATILREGPDVGIHTLVWCDTVTNLNRALDRRALREFAMRAVFQMSVEDSSNLIDTPAASKLGAYRGLFYCEEEGRLEKFQPYALPTGEWLAWVGNQLRQKKTPSSKRGTRGL